MATTQLTAQVRDRIVADLEVLRTNLEDLDSKRTDGIGGPQRLLGVIPISEVVEKLGQIQEKLRGLAMVAMLGVLFALPAHAQQPATDFVTICCDSISQYQMGFEEDEFPLLPPQNVFYEGQDSFTCEEILRMMPGFVPVRTQVVVPFELTNDARIGTPAPVVVGCLVRTISLLVNRNPAIKVVLPTAHPWRSDNCTGDRRALIAQYNALLPLVAKVFPGTVTLVDVWTPNVQADGWAIPEDITGFCGVHPGPEEEWSASWDHFMAPVTAAVEAVLP
jgi:hypothetical protein